MPSLRPVHFVLGAALCASVLLAGCGDDDGPSGPPAPQAPRTYRLGFSGMPPRPDFDQAVAAILMWVPRSDGAIFHTAPPWDSLLAGVPAETLLARNEKPLADFFHAQGLDVVVTLDLTDGLNRAAEAPALVEAGRSLTEPEVQDLFRRYAVAADSMLRPSRLGLGAELPDFHGLVERSSNLDLVARLYPGQHEIHVAFGERRLCGFDDGAIEAIAMRVGGIRA